MERGAGARSCVPSARSPPAECHPRADTRKRGCERDCGGASHPKSCFHPANFHSAQGPSCVLGRGLRPPLDCEQWGRGTREGGGERAGISHRDSRAPLRARAPRCARLGARGARFPGHSQSTAKAEVAERVSLPLGSRPPSFPSRGGGDAERVSTGPTTHPTLFPGSRGDNGVYLAPTDPGKMQPRRLPDHQTVP